MTSTPDFASAVVDWYGRHARDLPWRGPGVTPWGVLVSEVMLQQTPVARVEPVWHAWLRRWPAPADLAASPPGEAVRAWGRLGYPRRALRLHAAATVVAERHAGELPRDAGMLRALPGVGAYTAAAVLAFAYDEPVAVLDTNVRRVLARWRDARPAAPGSAPGRAETAAALAMVPSVGPGGFAVAVMELGALVCTARAPRCGACPVAAGCRWLAAGRPGADLPTGRAQPYAGTDRQVRGRLLAVVRDAPAAVPAAALEPVWDDAPQRDRALRSLVADGLVAGDAVSGYRLPG